MFDHIFSVGQWVKQTEYTGSVALLLKIPFGRNKCAYRCLVNLAPSCTRVHACSFCRLLLFPFLSEGSEVIPCHTAH